jgi:hypothetical protein
MDNKNIHSNKCHMVFDTHNQVLYDTPVLIT